MYPALSPEDQTESVKQRTNFHNRKKECMGERQRQRQTETDIQTNREKETETDRDRQRQMEIEIKDTKQMY